MKITVSQWERVLNDLGLPKETIWLHAEDGVVEYRASIQIEPDPEPKDDVEPTMQAPPFHVYVAPTMEQARSKWGSIRHNKDTRICVYPEQMRGYAGQRAIVHVYAGTGLSRPMREQIDLYRALGAQVMYE